MKLTCRQATDKVQRLVFGQDGGQSFWALRAQGVHRTQFLVEHLAIKEEGGAEGLVLCRSGDVFLDSQVGEKGFDLRSTHFRRVTHIVEVNVALDLAYVGLLRAIGIMFETDCITDLIRQLLGAMFFHQLTPPFDEKEL